MAWLIFEEIEIQVDTNIGSADANSPSTEEVRSKTTRIPRRTCALYMPGGLSVNDSIAYNPTDLGASGKFLKDAIGEKGLTSQTVSDAANDAVDFAADIGKNLFGGSGAADPGLIARVLRLTRLNGTGQGAGILAGVRAQANPHTHSLFQGVGIREFTFTFTLVPESRREQQEVKKIIQFFREAAYPDFGDFDSNGEVDDVAYRFPNIFQISQAFRNPKTGEVRINQDFEGNRIGFKYLPSHLKDVATNFDPENTLTLKADGNFPSYTLALTFQEERALSKQDIRDTRAGGY
jgi:hypothetical protein